MHKYHHIGARGAWWDLWSRDGPTNPVQHLRGCAPDNHVANASGSND